MSKQLNKITWFVSAVLLSFIVPLLIFKFTDICYQCQVGGAFEIGPNFLLITLAALTDSINPCALAVLMILLEGLILVRKKIVFTGMSFVFGIFLSYLLIGVGLISGINLLPNTTIIHLVVAILAMIVGIANIKDFFFYGKLFRTEIPLKWRPKMGALISRTTGPTLAFLIGFAISFFELPCTGGPYLFAVGILKNHSLLYLIYYNLIFVLPLLAIVLGVHYSYIKIEATEKWRQKNIKLLHLIAGIILVGIGSWLLLVSI